MDKHFIGLDKRKILKKRLLKVEKMCINITVCKFPKV